MTTQTLNGESAVAGDDPSSPEHQAVLPPETTTPLPPTLTVVYNKALGWPALSDPTVKVTA